MSRLCFDLIPTEASEEASARTSCLLLRPRSLPQQRGEGGAGRGRGGGQRPPGRPWGSRCSPGSWPQGNRPRERTPWSGSHLVPATPVLRPVPLSWSPPPCTGGGSGGRHSSSEPSSAPGPVLAPETGILSGHFWRTGLRTPTRGRPVTRALRPEKWPGARALTSQGPSAGPARTPVLSLGPEWVPRAGQQAPCPSSHRHSPCCRPTASPASPPLRGSQRGEVKAEKP